jgi:hypothetical protein
MAPACDLKSSDTVCSVSGSLLDHVYLTAKRLITFKVSCLDLRACTMLLRTSPCPTPAPSPPRLQCFQAQVLINWVAATGFLSFD